MISNSKPIPTRLLVHGVFDKIKKPAAKVKDTPLPLGDLSHEQLQRISVRLLSASTNAIQCQEYGIPGQPQEGIDLYARFPNQEKLEVWQCKRYQEFNPSDITNAVDTFIKGELLKESSKFVIVTSAATEERNLADAEIAAAKSLLQHNVQFELLGLTQLTTKLKPHPEIVDDFFGRDWVAECCGEESAEMLGNRLSGNQVSELREQLLNLYTSVFEQADSFVSHSLQVQTENSSGASLRDRWVMPSISTQAQSTSPTIAQSLEKTEANSSAYGQESESTEITAKEQLSQKKDHSSSVDLDADAFLGSADRGIVLGTPGQGKSTLFRMVTLDLLSECPCLSKVSSRFGNRLPIWLPFAFLNKQLSSERSVEDSVIAWLHTHGGEKTTALLEAALRDNRLLLLIDGLDEWSDADNAKASILKIQGFLSQQPEAACYFSARPIGFQRLDGIAGNWKQGTLLPLNKQQQEQLSSKIIHIIRGEDNAPVHIETERFTRELRKDESLGRIASTPLLLIGLVSLWSKNQALPHSRFQACEALVSEMLITQPSRRAASAGGSPIAPELSPDIRRSAIAGLAYTIHNSPGGTTLSKEEARDCFSNYFQEVEGMQKPQAREHARRMLPISDQIIGVITEANAQGEVQFIHRTFQEFLAAEYLYAQSMEKQTAACRDHAGDPAWYQVTLFLLQRTTRLEDTKALVDAIMSQDLQVAGSQYRELLIAEAVFSNIKLPPEIRDAKISEILDKIELGTWIPFREALLSKVLITPPGCAAYSALIDRLKSWHPCASGFRFSSGIAEAIQNWPKCKEADDALWNLLNHEQTAGKLSAAQAIGKRYSKDSSWKTRIIERFKDSFTEDDQACCIVALAIGWSKEPDSIEIFNSGISSTSNMVALASASGLVHAGLHNAACKKALMRLGDEIWFKDIFVETVLLGWPNDKDFKQIALDRLSDRYGPGHRIDYDAAITLLANGYLQEPDAAKLIGEKFLEKHSHLRLTSNPDRAFFDKLRNVPELLAIAKERLQKVDDSRAFDFAPIAALDQSQESKAMLIEWAKKGVYFGWPAYYLVEIWGYDDPEVQTAIKVASENPKTVDSVAEILANHHPDKGRIRSLLLAALQSSESTIRHDMILRGLKLLRTKSPDNEVVATVLGNPSLNRPWLETHLLLDGFSDHPQVKLLAEEFMSDVECPWEIIAKSFKDNSEIRKIVREKCRTLPESLRFCIVEHYRQNAAYNSAFYELAQSFRLETGSLDVRVTGAIGVAETAISLGEDTGKLAQYYADELSAVGLDHGARREAGLAGLISLGMTNILEVSEKKKGIPISFEYSHEGRDIIPQLIVQRWPIIKESFESPGWQEAFDENALVKLRDVSIRFGSSGIQEEIEDAICKRFDYKNIPLKILASRQTPRWQQQCYRDMGLLPKQGETTGYRVMDCDVAIRILAQYGEADPSIQRELEHFAASESHFPGNAYLALARGWPHSEAIKQLWIQETESGDLNNLNLWLVSLCAEVGDFISRLRKWMDEIARNGWQWPLSDDCWHVMRRCFQDEKVAKALLDILKDKPTNAEKVSFPWLILGNSLVGADSELKTWAEYQWETLDSKRSEYGLNILEGRVESIANNLQELLMTNKQYTL